MNTASIIKIRLLMSKYDSLLSRIDSCSFYRSYCGEPVYGFFMLSLMEFQNAKRY